MTLKNNWVNGDQYTPAAANAVANEIATKAPLASPTFTGTVAGITKTMVGLGSVDNTSDAAKPVSTAQQAALDLKQPLVAGTFPWPPNLVALWDFVHDTAGGATVTSRVGSQTTTLTALNSKTVVKDAADPGPFGPSLVLDGATFFCTSGLGALDVSQVGDEVTVIVWVKDTTSHDDTGAGLAFRAGSHNDGDVPSRQYGIYVDSWSASQSHGRLTPHIGAQDGPTPGYIYNYDSAHTARKLGTGTGTSQWHMEAMTFDGALLTAYIDGITDLFPNVSEGWPDAGQTATPRVVNRNPYPLRKGINRSTTTKYFSIGASAHTAGGSNPGYAFTTGKLGGVAVFSRALSAKELMQIRLATLLPGEAITMYSFEVASTGPHALSEIGWGSVGGANGIDVAALTGTEFSIVRPAGGSKSYMGKTSAALGGAWGPVTGLNSSQLRTVRFKLLSAAASSAAVRVLVKVGSAWWASKTTFAATSTHSGDTDWSGAETKTLAVAWDIDNWYPVTMTTTGGVATFQNLAKFSPALNIGSGAWFVSSGAAHATAARVASAIAASGFAYRFTWTGTDGNVSIGGLLYSGVAAITAGNVYSASILVSPSKPQKLLVDLIWYDSGNNYLSATSGAIVAVGQTTPTTLSVSGVAPAGATQVGVRVTTGGAAWYSGDTLDVTNCLVAAGAFLPPYFDGSAGAVWDGTAGNSTSTYTNMPTGVLTLGGSTNTAVVDNALITAVGFLSSGGDGSAVRVTDLQLLPT